MPLAAAIVPAVVSAGIGAAGKAYAAGQQKKAAGKALKAQQAAEAQQLALQREQQQKAEGLYRPAVQGGYAAFDQLLTRLGVQGAGQPQVRPPSGYVPGAEAAARRAADGVGGGVNIQGGGPAYNAAGQVADTFQPQQASAGPDWQAYLDANPDVAQNAAQRAAAEGIDPLTVAQQHWQNFGQTEGRQLPNVGETPQAAPTAPEAIQADPNAPPDYMNMARPEAPEAPTFQRPQDMQFRDYGDGPQFKAPTWQDIEQDPGFQWELKQGLNGVNAASAARGKLRSGDAARALQREGYGIAHSKGNDYFNRAMQGYNANRNAFQDNRNFGTNQTQWQQGRADNVFADDRAYDTARWQDQRQYGDARFDAERNYQTGRYDTQTANLFNIANMGQNAIGGTVTAGSQYANNAGNIYQNTANARADAAYQRADANAGLVGSIAGAVGNVFSNWGGGARPTGGQTVGQAWNTSFGGGWQTPHNPTFVNTPSSIRVF